MKSILKIEKFKILNIKFKKFKKFKKHHNINKITLSNFFMSSYFEKDLLCQRIMLLEALVGESFKITKIKFYNDNKKHFKLGVLIYLKASVFKKKVYPCLSYFYVYQFFLYYEFFLKANPFNSTEFANYFWFKPVFLKNAYSISFYFFMCWADLMEVFSYPTFKQFNEVFDTEERDPLNYVEHTQVDLIIFYKFSSFFFITLKVIKKNLLKLLIFFFKKSFFINLVGSEYGSKKHLFKQLKSKKLKLFLKNKYLASKNNVKA